mmetsp:Transcript_68289/g.177356  ORF Transcript_68289/g.177356 Transcript_68289/m.177356 type:complete len:562 (-) Transcript_68289:191-1876(-)
MRLRCRRAPLESALCLVALVGVVPGLAQLELGGGADGWDQSRWNVQVDGVMGGKSSGRIEYSNSTMVFSGNINLDGGGFSTARTRYTDDLDLSGYAGIVVELESEIYGSEKGAPLGLHVQFGDSSWYSFAAAIAVPFSAGPEREPCKIFIPMAGFDRASVMGSVCSTCRLKTKEIDELEVSVLFQEGPFEIRVRSITAVLTTPSELLPSTPSVAMTAQGVSSLISDTIAMGAALYDKRYRELCAAIYVATARQIVASMGPSQALRSLACVGLQQAASSSSKPTQAWVLRKAFDAILADIAGSARKADSAYPASIRGSWLLEPGVGSEDCDDLEESLMPDKASPAPSPAPAAAIDGFLGPFVGMGISGYNDLGSSKVSSPQACADKCQRDSRCRSFDYGARNGDRERVKGECWLSTANRESAGAAYRAWSLYDYYERSSDGGLGTSAPRGNELRAPAGTEDGDNVQEDGPAKIPGEDDTSGPVFWVILAGVLVLGLLLGAGAVLVCRRQRMSKEAPGEAKTTDASVWATGTAVDTGNGDPTTVVIGQPVSTGVQPAGAKGHE